MSSDGRDGQRDDGGSQVDVLNVVVGRRHTGDKVLEKCFISVWLRGRQTHPPAVHHKTKERPRNTAGARNVDIKYLLGACLIKGYNKSKET